MTIYKPNNPDRKQERKLINMPDVVIDDKLPLTKKTQNEGAAVLLVQGGSGSSAATLRRMMRCVVVLMVLLLVVLAVFSTGVIVYRYVQRMPVIYECRLKYKDDELLADPGTVQALRNDGQGVVTPGGERIGWYDEKVEVDQAGGAYEKLDVPPILDFRRSTVVHDFERNLTTIVDRDHARCFILPLNRSAVTQPKNFIDLLEKFKSGYYIPNAELVRDQYRVRQPAVDDISSFGPYIEAECQYFDSYLLTRDERPITTHALDNNQPINLSRRSRSVSCEMAGNGYCLGDTFTDSLRCITFTDCTH